MSYNPETHVLESHGYVDKVDRTTLICAPHGVHGCICCMVDDFECRPMPCRPMPRSIPRNLRRSTEGRCREWWREFAGMWGAIAERAIVGVARPPWHRRRSLPRRDPIVT